MKSSAEKPLLPDQSQEVTKPGIIRRIGKIIIPSQFFAKDAQSSDPPGQLDSPEQSTYLPDLRSVVAHCFWEKKVNIDNVPENDVSEIIQDTRLSIASDLGIIEAIEGNNKFIKYCSQVEPVRDAKLEFKRAAAPVDIDEKYGHVVRDWDNLEERRNKCALTDDVMKRFFVRGDNLKPKDSNGNDFLTTYFDTAQLGLKNDSLDREAVSQSRRDKLFDDSVPHGLKRFIELFMASQHANDFNHIDKDGMPRNIIFQENGTQAFQFFASHFMKEGKMLTTAEEFTDMFKGMEGRIVSLTQEEQLSEEAIRRELARADVKYMLASSLSRRGTIFPLERFYELCQKYGVYLIADVCQSFGRMAYNTPAHVVIGSSSKGADLDGDLNGFVMMSDDFINRDQETIEKALQFAGPQGTNNNALSKMLAACNPRLVGTLQDDDLDYATRSKMTSSVPEREAATKNLALKFAELTQAINRANGNKIEFFNHDLVYPNSEVDKKEVSCIFECRIQGASIAKVKEVTSKYGISISDDYSDPWDPGSSFRVCFHPFMNDDSVKILCRALEECC